MKVKPTTGGTETLRTTEKTDQMFLRFLDDKDFADRNS
jgi:hypothetical protein